MADFAVDLTFVVRSIIWVEKYKYFINKMAGVLFEDIFNVKDIDPEGKKFDRGKLLIIFSYF